MRESIAAQDHGASRITSVKAAQARSRLKGAGMRIDRWNVATVVGLLVLGMGMLAGAGCGGDDDDSGGPEEPLGSGGGAVAPFDCGSEQNVLIIDDADWRRFVQSGCDEVHNLTLRQRITSFSGEAAIDLIINGSLTLSRTHLSGLTEIAADESCAGLCNVMGIHQNLKLIDNGELTSAHLPKLQAIAGNVEIYQNNKLASLDLQLLSQGAAAAGYAGAQKLTLHHNDVLADATFHGRINMGVKIYENGQFSPTPMELKLLWRAGDSNEPHTIPGQIRVWDNPGLGSFLWLSSDEEPFVDGITTGAITLSGNEVLTTVSLPELTSVTGPVTVKNNPALTSFKVASDAFSGFETELESHLIFMGNGTAGVPLSFDFPMGNCAGAVIFEDNGGLDTLVIGSTETFGPVVIAGNDDLQSVMIYSKNIGYPGSRDAPDERTGLFIGRRPNGAAKVNPSLHTVLAPLLELVGHGREGEGISHASWYGNVDLFLESATDVDLGSAGAGLEVRGNLRIAGIEGQGLDLSKLQTVGLAWQPPEPGEAPYSYGGYLIVPWHTLSAPLTSLQTVYGGMELSGVGNLALLGLSNLTSVGPHRPADGRLPVGLRLTGDAITSMDGAFPALALVGALEVIETDLTHLDFGGLETVTRNVTIRRNSLLRNASIESVKTIGGKLVIAQNGWGLAPGETLWLHPMSVLCTTLPAAPAWCSECAGANPADWCGAPAVGSAAGFGALTSVDRAVILGNRTPDKSAGLPWCWAETFTDILPGPDGVGHNWVPQTHGDPCVVFQENPCRDGALDPGSEACDPSVSCDADNPCPGGSFCEGETCWRDDVASCPCAGTLSCSSDCTAAIRECEACCGNGEIDTDQGETCDGAVFPESSSCDDLTGLALGEVRCTETCELDTAGCFGCGDGIVQSFDSESLICADPDACAHEECDMGVGSTTCVELGFDGGSLSCDMGENACTFDTSGCFKICDSLDHHYRFEEEVGDLVYDAAARQASSLNTQGDADPGAMRTSGDGGSEHLLFNDTDDGAQLLGPDDELAGTIALHLKLTPESANDSYAIVGGSNFRLIVNATAAETWTLEIDAAGLGDPVALGVTLPSHTWLQLAFTWDQTHVTTYLSNGSYNRIIHQLPVLKLKAPLELGYHSGWGAGDKGAAWAAVDEVTVFSGALSLEAVRILFRRSHRQAGTGLCGHNVCGDEVAQSPNSLGVDEDCEADPASADPGCTLPGTVVDGMLKDCQLSSSAGCGNGTVEAGLEDCDPPGSRDQCDDLGGGVCGSNCKCQGGAGSPPGAIDPECDPPGSNCSLGLSCNMETNECEENEGSCGDDFVDPGEGCDTGVSFESSNQCAAGEICAHTLCECEDNFTCGDGVLDVWEECQFPGCTCHHLPTKVILTCSETDQDAGLPPSCVCADFIWSIPTCNNDCRGCTYIPEAEDDQCEPPELCSDIPGFTDADMSKPAGEQCPSCKFGHEREDVEPTEGGCCAPCVSKGEVGVSL